jgi:hypothetical protein
MLILKQEDYNKIVDHAKKGLPNEACLAAMWKVTNVW